MHGIKMILFCVILVLGAVAEPDHQGKILIEICNSKIYHNPKAAIVKACDCKKGL